MFFLFGLIEVLDYFFIPIDISYVLYFLEILFLNKKEPN